MPPPLIAAGIGAAASIGGAALGASAQKKAGQQAATTAQNTANMNNALARDMYAKNEGHLSPFMQAGHDATGQLNALLQGDQSAFDAFRNSTNYNFLLNEGMRGVNQGYAARGALQSGAALKGMNNYAQGMAGNALGGYMGMLQGQQNAGLMGASALAGHGQQMTNALMMNNLSAGQVAAQNQLNAGAANAGMWGGIGGALGNFAGSLGSSFKPSYSSLGWKQV